MIIAITGTPGTGKSTTASILSDLHPVLHLNEVVKNRGFYSGIDEQRGSLEVEMEALELYLQDLVANCQDLIIEGHIAHLLHIDYDMVIVLRCMPSRLCDRLRAKEFNEDKIRENVEAEALDIILVEALEGGFKAVYEIDTTERDVNGVAACISEIIEGDLEAYRVGGVDWSYELWQIADGSFWQDGCG